MTLEDLYRLLRDGHVQSQGVVDTIQSPLVVLDQHLCVTSANPAFLEAFHVTRDETLGENFLQLGNGQWNNPELEVLLRCVIPKSAAVVGFQIDHKFPVLGQRTMLVSARRLVHPDNTSQSMLIVFEDITDQRAQFARYDLMAAEVRHRFKNFLAVLSSLARQSPADGLTVEEYRDTLLGRIDALAEAEIAAFKNEEAELQELLVRVLAPYGDRVQTSQCPPTKIEARRAASLSMILHELATNAVKYGSLSTPLGHVQLECTLTPGKQSQLQLVWRERGGPPAKDAPHDGFGSRLIRMIASQQLGGSADLHFESEGLTAEITIPASGI
ncbi:HWE histidine kinase domain-containing protein [Aestuariivirga sp.]|uniref:HWE histidine kinase domain-containing protein n=1 Tax=Aestuariivirga sp. TaxID=2650926 RepID=UPI00391BC008